MLARLEAQHEALIAALDANDISAMAAASGALEADLEKFRGFDSWFAAPEVKLAAERIGRLADAAMRRVHVLQDRAAKRSDALAAARGQGQVAVYSR